MNNSLNTPCNSLNKHNKDNTRQPQIKTIFQYLENNIATASMVAESTNIPQKNITRYKRDLEKSGKLWEVEKKKCSHTGFKAWYLTTNPKYAPKQSIQLNLFETV